MNMPPGINLDADRINAFCRKWNVEELSLFGSVLRPSEFRPDSDVDVLVRFSAAARPDLFDLSRMEQELAAMIGHTVDLVDKTALEHSANYIRREHILASQQPIYVAR